MSRQGVFIAIEGSDGTGKATQVALLADRLRGYGHTVEVFNFPQYESPSSFFVREYLAGRYGPAQALSPYTSALFYALDRFHVATQIKQALNSGKVVLADRYIGSNMAHQGAKFDNSEARRGFFVWVDGVEAQMLGIPRPDISLILKVPTAISQSLIEGRQRVKDEHEANTAHLQSAQDVYADLCRLFPRDFMEIDCVRNGKLMSKSAIHNILWGAVEPLLPMNPARQHETTPITTAQTDGRMPESESQAKPTAELSLLLATQLGIYAELPTTTSYYTPAFNDEQTAAAWNQSLYDMQALHDQVTTTTAHYLAVSGGLSTADALAQASDASAQMLPYALTVRVSITDLRGAQSDLLEASEHGLSQTWEPGPFAASAQNHLPDNHAPATESSTLIDYWPRNELDLLPEMLFQHSNLPLAMIRDEISRWPISQKQDALAQYVQYHANDKNSVLSLYRYVFDGLGDRQTIVALSQGGASVATQQFTPRYGYEVPICIERAGMSDQFERCFEISLRLHSTLQAAKLLTESQYACLLGHKQRFAVTVDLTNQSNTLTRYHIDDVHPVTWQSLRGISDRSA